MRHAHPDRVVLLDPDAATVHPSVKVQMVLGCVSALTVGISLRPHTVNMLPWLH